MEIKEIAVDKLKRDINQPRHTFDNDLIKEMSQSIQTEGIINPIEIDKDNTIITGEQRWRAAKYLGLKTVPCKVLSIKDPMERYRRQFIENAHHNTMTDWDTAKALKKLMDWVAAAHSEDKYFKPNEIGLRKLSTLIGKSTHYIRTYLQILSAPSYIRDNVKKGNLGFSMVEELKRLPEEYQEEITKKFASGEFGGRDKLREMARAINRTPEYAKEILKAKTLEEIFQISPSAHQIVKERLKPAAEFIKIKEGILHWLEQNPPESIVHKDRLLTVLSMSLIVEKLNGWGKNAQQLTLK